MGKRLRARSLVASAVIVLAAAGACTDTAEDTGDATATEAPEAPSTLVSFDAKKMEWTEGVAVDADGNVYTGITPQGRLMRIEAGSETAEEVGKVEGIREGDFGLLGLDVDDNGNVYASVVSKNAAANGVWQFDVETGDPERIPGTEEIAFGNALVIDDETIYVSDTTGADGKGAIWRITEDDDPEIWLQHDLIAGDGSAGYGFNLGPNGIDVHDDVVYVGVTEKARIVAIPIEDDGTAGEPTVFADLSKAADGKPAAVDGIALDADGNVYVAAPLVHSVLKVGSNGEDISTVDAGDDLDGPASVFLTDDALYVSNFSGALGEASNKKGPSIVRVPL